MEMTCFRKLKEENLRFRTRSHNTKVESMVRHLQKTMMDTILLRSLWETQSQTSLIFIYMKVQWNSQSWHSSRMLLRRMRSIHKSNLNISFTTSWSLWFKLVSSSVCYSLYSTNMMTMACMWITISVYFWWSSFPHALFIWCFIHLLGGQWWLWNMWSTTQSISLIQILHSVSHSLIWTLTLQRSSWTCSCSFTSTPLNMRSSISLLLKSL